MIWTLSEPCLFCSATISEYSCSSVQKRFEVYLCTIRECPHCLEYEIHNKLKPRILKKGEQRPPDYDQSIQCWECGNIFPIYQSYPETEIKDSEETVQTPSENESVFMSSKKKKYRDRRLSSLLDDDPDIQADLDKGNTVNIL